MLKRAARQAAQTATAARHASSSSSSTSPPRPPPKSAARRSDLPNNNFFRSLTPDALRVFDPTFDVHPGLTERTESGRGQPFPHSVTFLSPVTQPRPRKDQIIASTGDEDTILHLANITGLSKGEIKSLHRYPLVVKRVVQMTPKGKQPSMYALVVVGNGNGLVGVGEGNDESAQKAVQKGFVQAVRSMDAVERREDRTVWGTMKGKFGSCEIEMRSRPPGFGLRVNPFIHQVAKAAGISDLSAKVYGSLNRTRVIKLACQMLQGGTVPLDMGEFGRKAQRKNKMAHGMRTADELARTRGRQAIAL